MIGVVPLAMAQAVATSATAGSLRLADQGELLRQHLQLRQNAIVNFCPATAFRQRIFGAVPAAQGALFKHHIGEEWNALGNLLPHKSAVSHWPS
ncbi:hypothetical protein [Rhizobium lusitanum]|uniref:Uncharacterized protein n=1 Tax=Rhizobium lusitanum TaxID=293958 RepID=A0A7X0ITV7_9HYPH|nr:hypothetical protein [Rhizobium lusitanum]MBB6486979.1 hypothetical protein [Rhizobium lusitanum]